MKQRKFSNDISTSELTFGSMRFEFNSDSEAENLIRESIEIGINTFHTSFEYPCHSYFSYIFGKVKKDFPSKHFHHIVKLGEPHFDSNIFNPKRFESIIDEQLLALNSERIDIVQWLLRHTPNTNKFRLKILEESYLRFNETVKNLKKEGKIKSVGSHPYSFEFAKKVDLLSKIDCWVTYLNLLEIEWEQLLDKPFIAIRPLAAGKILKNNQIWELLKKHSYFDKKNKLELALKFPLLHPNVKTLIISIRNLDQLDSIENALKDTSLDLNLFNSIIFFLKKKKIQINEPID